MISFIMRPLAIIIIICRSMYKINVLPTYTHTHTHTDAKHETRDQKIIIIQLFVGEKERSRVLFSPISTKKKKKHLGGWGYVGEKEERGISSPPLSYPANLELS